MTKYIAEMQAVHLLEKSVNLTDPNNNKATITGTVTSATINGSNSTITIGGKDYPF